MAYRSVRLSLETLESRLNLSRFSSILIPEASQSLIEERAALKASATVRSLAITGSAAHATTTSAVSTGVGSKALAAEDAPVVDPDVSATSTTKAISLTWTETSTNITGYRVERSTDGVNFTTIAKLGKGKDAYTDKKATPGVTYTYRITPILKASTAISPSAARNPNVVSIALAIPPAPAAAANVTASRTTATSTTLTWSDTANNETGYRVYRSTDGVNYTLVANLRANVQRYVDTGLSEATTYYYKVAAWNLGGEGSAALNVTTLPTLPGAPGDLTVATASGSTLTLTWSDNAYNESGYSVYRSTNGVTYSLVGSVGANGTTYTDSNLRSTTKYYYRVAAYNAAGQMTSKAVKGATTIAAPVAPTDLTISDLTTDGDTLTWSDNSTTESGFNVYRSTDGTNFTLVTTVAANAMTFTDSGLTDGTTYTYAVSAVNVGGESASATASAMTIAATVTPPANTPTDPSQPVTSDPTGPVASDPVTTDPTPPSDPVVTAPVVVAPTAATSIATSGVTTSGATISWSDDVSNVMAVNVYRSTDGVNYSLVATLSADATTFTDGSLAANTAYSYEIGLSNSAGETVSSAVSATTQMNAPVAPVGVSVGNVTNSGVTLSWTGGTDSSSFNVYRSSNGSNYTLVATVSGGTTTYTDASLGAGTSYSYVVSAVNAGGETKAAAISATTIVAAPTAVSSLTGGAITSSSDTLTWSDAAAETGYHIYRSTDGTNFTLVATTGENTTSWTDSTVGANTTYYYKVGAYNAGGETVSATTSLVTQMNAPGSPTSVVTSALSNSSIAVSWSAVTGSSSYNVYRSTAGGAYTLVGTLNASTTSYTDTALAAGTTYSYIVSAVNAGGEAKASAVNATTIVNAPEAIGSVATSGITNAGDTLSWSSVSGATGYEIYRSTDGSNYTLVATAGSTATSWSDASLNANTTYYYKVGAFNAGGETLSTVKTLTTLVNAPSTPTEITASVLGSTSIGVSWSAVAGSTSYNVYRSTNGTTYTLVSTLNSGTTTYTDASLAAGTSYSYVISAVNAGGETKASAVSATTLVNAPAAVGSVATSGVTNTGDTLSWSSVSGATGYDIYRSTDGSNYTLVATAGSTATSWSDASLNANTTYYYKVGAFNAGGETLSTVKTLTTLVNAPSTPTGITASVLGSTSIGLSWSAVSGSTSYNVYRSTNGTTYTLVSTLSSGTTTYTDASLAAGTSYSYVISAVNAGGETKASAVNATTLVAAPNAVASVTASGITSSGDTLAWMAASTATGYHIYRSTDGTNYTLVATVGSTATNWSDGSLIANTTYTYKVGAYNAGGETASAVKSVTTLVNAPTMPTGIATSVLSSSSISVSWSAVSGSTSYNVYRSTNGTTYTLIGTMNSGTTTYTDGSLASGTSYSYVISAVNAGDETKAPAVTATTLVAAPTSVTSISSSGITQSSDTLSWSDTSGETGYHIYRSTDGTNYTLVASTNANTTTWSDSSLSAGTAYYYKVGAYNAGGETVSASTSLITLVNAPTAPTGTATSGITTTSVSLSWTASSTASGYRIYRSTDGTNFTLAGSTLVGVNTWTDSADASGTTYYYKVAAYNGGGETQAAAVSATTIVAAPTTVTFSNVGTTAATVTWNNVTGNTGYHVYRSTDGMNYTLVATTSSNAVTWTDSSLAGSTTYYYKVGAFNTSGESAAVASVTTATPQPAVSITTANMTSFTELVITGTTGNDSIMVSQSNGVLSIVANGQTYTYQNVYGDMKIYGGDGNDSITVNSSVNIATLIYSGDGNDVVNNFTSGKATIVSLGTGTKIVTGNGINTAYWANMGDTVNSTSAEVALGGVNRIGSFYQPWTTSTTNANYISTSLTGQNLADPTDSGNEIRLTHSSLFGTGATMQDVNQTSISDCYFLAPLSSLAGYEQQKLMNMAVDLGDGTYAVRFVKNGVNTFVRVDGDLSSGYWGYGLANQTPGASGNEWASIFEKAYAFFRSGSNTYSSLNYGSQAQSFADLGFKYSATLPSLISASYALTTINTQLAAGHAMVASTTSNASAVVASHSYSIIGAYTDANGNVMIQLRNPWGTDGTGGDSVNDGNITITFATFQSNFNQLTWATT